MFYDKFISLCENNGVSPSRVALDIGLSKSSVTNWKKEKAVPSAKTMKNIADYFGISVSELLDEKVIGETGKKIELFGNTEQLSKKDIELINWFRSLPVEKQKAILAIGDAPKGLV